MRTVGKTRASAVPDVLAAFHFTAWPHYAAVLLQVRVVCECTVAVHDQYIIVKPCATYIGAVTVIAFLCLPGR